MKEPIRHSRHTFQNKEKRLIKTTLCITLLTFVMLAFVPNSFAQENSPEYLVRVIYFIPNDRQPNPDIDKMLDTEIKEAQHFFADQLEAHGFDRKTFKIETDDAGYAIVHHVNGRHHDAHYQNPSFGSSSALNEIEEQFDMSKNIYYIALDSSSIFLDGREITGWAYGDSVSGVAFVTAHENVPTIHELGHAFGLSHDYRSNFKANRVYTSDFKGFMTTTYCAAEWLYAHRYFNSNPREVNNNTKIHFHPAELIKPPTKIRLKFTLTDLDGLHQAHLLHPQGFLPEQYNHLAEINESTLAACQRLSGKQDTVEFVTRDLVGPDNLTSESIRIWLAVMDMHGNFTSHPFDIDMTQLLSPHDVVSIQDTNLASVIREELDLASDELITNLNMLRLTELLAVDRNIKNLTGLENAIYLRELNLLDNQIKDITPLSKLPYLIDLSIGSNKIRDITPIKNLKHLESLSLGDNPISDITVLTSLKSLKNLSIGGTNSSYKPIRDISPVWELTQLRFLSLRFLKIRDLSPLTNFTDLTQLQVSNNKIKDITPLAELTGLTKLSLNDNEISDVRPLTTLTKLNVLNLQDNLIKNRKPLYELLEKNPDIKIYLKWGGKPLPVNLSHFRAELSDAGVILKWITESEVDNAGFYIYRSETRDGEFKIVNPALIQGAGTTGERNEYTWTDTIAKPNTVYYYRIEDVSHAGVREQLGTVRLRGLVSASGKLTTTWVDLKAGH